MLHVRVALDGEQIRDPYAPELRHAPDVVASQIDEHQVLGPLLLVRQQGAAERLVLFRRPAARPGARDGAHRHLPLLHPYQHLGRAPDQREVVEREIEEVGRRVQRPQVAIQQERVDRARRVLAA